MNKPNQPGIDDTVRDLLVRLGRDLSSPLESLLAETHALDERNARDDGAARLVELAYELRTILEPITAFARLLSTPPADEIVRIDVRELLTKVVSEPEVAASFRLSVHGELGVSFDDRARLEQGLELCYRLLSRMSSNKMRLHVHREVHDPADRVVLTTNLEGVEPVALALIERAACAVGVALERNGSSVTLGFHVGRLAARDTSGPVLAFRRHQPAPCAEPAPEARAPVIVVVDSEPAARAYMGRLLELEGFEVVSCASLEQADEAMHAYRPDLVIVDRLQLDQEDGDWVRRFRANPTLSRTPLVLMQGAESESLGLVSASAVVTKPIDPNEIMATVERLTGSGSAPIVFVRTIEEDSKWQRCLEGQTRVLAAASVSEAERLLDAVTPRILIVDTRGVDGALELLEAFRRNDTESVPVVAVHGRLSRKARLRLDAVADARMTFSELTPRSLDAVLVGFAEEERRTELGAG